MSAIETLVESHRELLAFLERRVGDRAIAEDILQETFVRGIDKLGTLTNEESIRAWFYRSLRNAVVDYYRRRQSSHEALASFAAELEATHTPDDAFDGAVCQCVARLAATLKPEYAEALRRVEVDGLSVKDFAAEEGISAANAGVRIFRARDALRRQVTVSCGTCAEHGCLNCTCGMSRPGG